MDRVTLTTRDGHTFVYETEDMQQAATDALLHAARLSNSIARFSSGAQEPKVVEQRRRRQRKTV